MSPAKSDIWHYFIKIKSGGKCKLCQREVKTSGNTTNLKNHLKRHHPSLQQTVSKTVRYDLIQVYNIIYNEFCVDEVINLFQTQNEEALTGEDTSSTKIDDEEASIQSKKIKVRLVNKIITYLIFFIILKSSSRTKYNKQ